MAPFPSHKTYTTIHETTWPTRTVTTYHCDTGLLKAIEWWGSRGTWALSPSCLCVFLVSGCLLTPRFKALALGCLLNGFSLACLLACSLVKWTHHTPDHHSSFALPCCCCSCWCCFWNAPQVGVVVGSNLWKIPRDRRSCLYISKKFCNATHV